MKHYGSVDFLIGNTPILRLRGLEEKTGSLARIYAKLESCNPAGSVKDRVAKYIIDDAEKKGSIKAGSVIIEPTSGNTGIGIAMISAARGYRAIIVMPDTMSIERRRMIEAYGAEVVLTDGALGMKGAIEYAERLRGEIPGSIIAGQFENPANPKAHFETTGPEILDGMDKNIDAFVCCVGTGGTISGVGKYLKSNLENIRVYAVEPEGSAILSGGKAGAHGIQGIGAGFIPKTLDTASYDEVITVSDEEAYEYARLVMKTDAVSCGISSGAALAAVLKLAKDPVFKDKNIVTILPDGSEKYLSTKLFNKGE